MADPQRVYLHGFPGGPEELQAFGVLSSPFFAPDRRHDAPHLEFRAYVDHVARVISARFPDGALTLIGFSAGARIALELSVKLDDRVDEIILISAAAPLQSGTFLPEMAGRLVFCSAQKSPFAFRALTAMQARISRWAPSTLYQKLFSSARGADQQLKFDARFKQLIQSVIVKTLRSGAVGYKREVRAYVQPWSDLLPRVKTPVTLWHGTADNWTPIGMADALAAALPNVRAVHRLPTLSHFSTLQMFLASLQNPAPPNGDEIESGKDRVRHGVQRKSGVD